MEKKGCFIITGVNGFIGNYLSFECIKRNIKTIGVDLNSKSINNKITYYQMDLCTSSIIELLKKYKPDTVIHCAGSADVNYSMAYPEKDFVLNVIMPRNILYAIKDYSPQTKFLFLSSAAVYGNPQLLPITENHLKVPISSYALHKSLVEDICQYFVRQYNLDIRILRIFSAYGNGLKKQIFWDMGRKLYETGKLEMFGTGNESRDFIHINDLINAIFLILGAGRGKQIIYNVANGLEITIKEIAEIFCYKCGKSKDIIFFNNKMRDADPVNWCADISKLKKLGYRQTVEISDGIECYVRWLKECLKN